MTFSDALDWLAMRTVKPSMSPFYEPKQASIDSEAPCCKLSRLEEATYVMMMGRNGQPYCWEWKTGGVLVLVPIDELPKAAICSDRWYTATWYLYEDPHKVGDWYLSEGWITPEAPV